MTLTAFDMFAGAGGFTTGAEAAGVKVLGAINHWQVAVNTHSKNSKRYTKHFLDNAFHFDYRDMAPDVDLLLASPACQGHSTAATHGLSKGRRGTAPAHDGLRATAEAVPEFLEIKRPSFAIVENVFEFVKWVRYRGWRIQIEDMGYLVKEHFIQCADFGTVPSKRERLFISIVHKSVSKTPFDFHVPKKRHKPFGPCLSKNVSQELWTPFASNAPGVKKIMRRGRKQVPKGLFVINNVSQGKAIRPESEPLRTVTTQAGHWKAVRRGKHGDEARCFTIEEYVCAMGFPKNYKLPTKNKGDCNKLIGNAVPPPVARELVKQIVKRG